MRTSLRKLRLCLVVIGGVVLSSAGEAQDEAGGTLEERTATVQARDPLTWITLSDAIFREAEGLADLPALDVCNAIADAGGAARASAVARARDDAARAEARALIGLIDFFRGAFHFTRVTAEATNAAGIASYGPFGTDTQYVLSWVTRAAAALEPTVAPVDAALETLRVVLRDADGVPTEEQLEAGRDAARLLFAPSVALLSNFFFVVDVMRQRDVFGAHSEEMQATADGALNAAEPALFAEAAVMGDAAARDAVFDDLLRLGVDAAIARGSFVGDVKIFATALFEYATSAEILRRIEDCAGPATIEVPRGTAGPWTLRGPVVIDMPLLEGGALYGQLSLYLWGGDLPWIDGDITFVVPATGEEGWDAIRHGAITNNTGGLTGTTLNPDNTVAGTLRVWDAGDFADIVGPLLLVITGVLEENADNDGWTVHGDLALPETLPAGWAALFDVAPEPGAGIMVGTFSATIEIPLGYFETH